MWSLKIDCRIKARFISKSGCSWSCCIQQANGFEFKFFSSGSQIITSWLLGIFPESTGPADMPRNLWIVRAHATVRGRKVRVQQFFLQRNVDIPIGTCCAKVRSQLCCCYLTRITYCRVVLIPYWAPVVWKIDDNIQRIVTIVRTIPFCEDNFIYRPRSSIMQTPLRMNIATR